jgi:23S rRNA pseudouridine2457 synthase
VQSDLPAKSIVKAYILFYKPYGVLSQFTPEAGHRSLHDAGRFPAGVYPVGRLDWNSEGLLFLTNDNEVKRRLIDPSFQHPRTYLVQTENIPTPEAVRRLRNGVRLDGRTTKPAEVRLLHDEPHLHARPEPIRIRKNIPTAWLEMILHEGRNRQVRRMTAAVGFPTLRLIRTAIAFLTFDGLEPGQQRKLHREEVERLLGLLHIRS